VFFFWCLPQFCESSLCVGVICARARSPSHPPLSCSGGKHYVAAALLLTFLFLRTSLSVCLSVCPSLWMYRCSPSWCALSPRARRARIRMSARMKTDHPEAAAFSSNLLYTFFLLKQTKCTLCTMHPKKTQDLRGASLSITANAQQNYIPLHVTTSSRGTQHSPLSHCFTLPSLRSTLHRSSLPVSAELVHPRGTVTSSPPAANRAIPGKLVC
jgi:hypothetical protein